MPIMDSHDFAPIKKAIANVRSPQVSAVNSTRWAATTEPFSCLSE
ncbi:hypothetical protein ACQ4M4_28490 [Leptolyngbya sp. AN02str]